MDDVLSGNLSDCLECFNLIFNGLLDLLTSLRVHQQHCPWLPSISLTKACHLCDIAHHKALRSGSVSDWSSYRSLCNKVNCILKQDILHFSDLSTSLRGNLGKFWRHFQSLSKFSKPHSDIQFSNTADTFNKHFLSIPYRTIADVTSTVPATEFMERFFDNRVVPSMQFAYVDIEIVSSIVNNLDIHKAMGADGLPLGF